MSLTKKQARATGIPRARDKTGSKYKSKKVELDGITFDSRKEARKYEELKLMKLAGEVLDFELQPEFELQPGYRDKSGKWIRPIKYRADFKVTYPDGRVLVIDTKGYPTKDYILKRKMLLFRYPDIEFREE